MIYWCFRATYRTSQSTNHPLYELLSRDKEPFNLLLPSIQQLLRTMVPRKVEKKSADDDQ